MRKEVYFILNFALALLAKQTFNYPSSRIVGGRVQEITKAPWYVTVNIYEIVNQTLRNNYCGGSIISPSVVLTAAHCIIAKTIYKITLRIGSSFYKTGGKIIDVLAIAVHPKYNSSHLDYGSDGDFDIGLIWLEEDITFSKTIQPIALYDIEESLLENNEAEICGMGSPSWGTLMPSKLRCVSLRADQKGKCDFFSDTETNFSYNSYTICAGSITRNICFGDSGSGLIMHGKLVGIASRTFCGLYNSSSLFTSLTTLKTWTQGIHKNFSSYLDIVDFIYTNISNIRILECKNFNFHSLFVIAILKTIFGVNN